MLTLIGLLVKMGDALENKGIPLYDIYLSFLFIFLLTHFIRINVLEGFRTAASVCEKTLNSIAIPFSTIHKNEDFTAIQNNSIPQNSDTGNNFRDGTTNSMDLVDNINFSRFSTESFLNGPNSNKGSTALVTDMLSKLGITTPPAIPEMDDNDDVSWFFDGDGVDEDNLVEKDSLNNNITLVGENEISSGVNEKLQLEDVSEIKESNDILEIIGRGLAHGNEEMMAIAVRVAQFLVAHFWWFGESNLTIF